MLYSNTYDETFKGSDTNHVVVQDLNGAQRVVFLLSYAPIPYTVNAIADKGNLLGQMPLYPQMQNRKNVLVAYFSKGMNAAEMEFTFRYIKDERETNVFKSIQKQGTNAVILDGIHYGL